MEIKLGNRITCLRKAQNMTQESLARELGVTAPAISKWETDSSFPDVAMLCPLARALDTDLNTLFSFEETLSEIEIRDIGAKLLDMVYAGQGYQAEEELIGLLRTYPSDVALKISAISIYNMLLSTMHDAPDHDKARWNEGRKELAEWIYDSEDPTYRNVAISILIAALLEENDLDRVESLLQEVEKSNVDIVDFTMHHRVSLHLKKGEKEQAMQTLRRQQTLSAVHLLNAMMGMLREDMEPDQETILSLCEQMQAIEKMFHIENPSYGLVYVESYIRAGEYEKALDYLETCALHARPELKPIMLQALSLDELFEPVRGEPRFMKIIDGLYCVAK